MNEHSSCGCKSPACFDHFSYSSLDMWSYSLPIVWNNESNRGVAIYARKSRITNKGDSIGVQFKQCTEYAKRALQLNDKITALWSMRIKG